MATPKQLRSTLLIVLLLSALQGRAQQQTTSPPIELTRNTVTRELNPGAIHVFRIDLQPGQFLGAVFQQRGIDVVIRAVGPDGQQLAEVDSPNGVNGPELVELVAKSSGTHRLEVRALVPSAPAGTYDARLVELLDPAEYAVRLAAEQADLDETKRWLQRSAVALATVEAGNGFADMEPVKKIVGTARIVSLGEATHGSREFFQLKHRMLEFLVTQMGFTLFGIEASMPEGFDVNRYVLTGQGDPVGALGGLYFWTWDTEEVLALIKWMRQYNADPSHVRKVKFYGFDMQSSSRAVRVMLTYLAKVDPKRVAEATAPLSVLSSPVEESAYSRRPAAIKAAAAQAADDTLRAFDEHRADYISKTSADEWAVARQHARILVQKIGMENLNSEGGITGFNVRDRSMAENVGWILDREGPDAKIALWAHNGHVADAEALMGRHLRQAYGGQMAIFGFAFNRGGFQARGFPVAENYLPRTFTVPAAPEGSLDASLAAAGLRVAAIDLRTLPKDGPVARWFAKPRGTRSIGALFSDEMANVLGAERSQDVYDALLFVDSTTPARPNRTVPVRAALGALPQPVNLSFEEAGDGQAPAGWTPVVTKFGFVFASDDTRPYDGRRSALLARAAGTYYGEYAGEFGQSIDAAPFRGKRIRVRVMARAELPTTHDRAYIRVYALRANMQNPDSSLDQLVAGSDWQPYQTELDVAENAHRIVYGMALAGIGRTWLDAVTIEVVPGPQ